jgi:uncharacterized protein YjbI with pentapeptide repeats
LRAHQFADERAAETRQVETVVEDHVAWVASSGDAGSRGDLSRRLLKGMKFTGRDLSGMTFVDADLTGADFSGCRLVLCDFSGALLAKATFDDADASGATFIGADLRAVSFRNALLDAVPIKAAGGGVTGRMKTPIFAGALLAGADFTGTDTSACGDLQGI